jgi:hypothetical protein
MQIEKERTEHFRDTLRVAACHLADDAATETRYALRELVRTLRADGTPPEQVVARLKGETRSVTSALGWDTERWLMDHVVRIAVQELYRAD